MPSLLMQQLYADHRNFSVLLDILEHQIGLLPTAERTSLEVAEMILTYLKRYGSQCHHPREDLIYGKLRGRKDLFGQLPTKLVEEHASLFVTTNDALSTISHILDGEAHDIATTARMLTGYLCAYRAHVESEDASLFSTAREYMTADDWSQVEKEAAVFTWVEHDLHTQERFLAMRDYIHRLNRLNPGRQS